MGGVLQNFDNVLSKHWMQKSKVDGGGYDPSFFKQVILYLDLLTEKRDVSKIIFYSVLSKFGFLNL